MRLPAVVSADAVRRVVCDDCQRAFEPAGEAVVDLGVIDPGAYRGRAPGWLSDPESRAWRYLSIPVAAAAVIGALVLIRGC